MANRPIGLTKLECAELSLDWHFNKEQTAAIKEYIAAVMAPAENHTMRERQGTVTGRMVHTAKVVPFEEWEKELAKLPRIGKGESPRDKALSALVAAMNVASDNGTCYPMPTNILEALHTRGWDITQRR